MWTEKISLVNKNYCMSNKNPYHSNDTNNNDTNTRDNTNGVTVADDDD
jgi:hypothetical protein